MESSAGLRRWFRPLRWLFGLALELVEEVQEFARQRLVRYGIIFVAQFLSQTVDAALSIDDGRYALPAVVLTGYVREGIHTDATLTTTVSFIFDDWSLSEWLNRRMSLLGAPRR